MAIPTESSRNVMTGLGGISTDYVLDRTCGDVTVVRSTGGKWWAVVESIWGKMFGKFELFFEAFVLLPVVKNEFFLIREGESFRSCVIKEKYLS